MVCAFALRAVFIVSGELRRSLGQLGGDTEYPLESPWPQLSGDPRGRPDCLRPLPGKCSPLLRSVCPAHYLLSSVAGPSLENTGAETLLFSEAPAVWTMRGVNPEVEVQDPRAGSMLGARSDATAALTPVDPGASAPVLGSAALPTYLTQQRGWGSPRMGGAWPAQDLELLQPDSGLGEGNRPALQGSRGSCIAWGLAFLTS